MEKFIDEKIKEIGRRVGPISFDKGTDNYNTMKKILTETYMAGSKGIDDLFVDLDYPLIHD
jgi:hypothetical protein